MINACPQPEALRSYLRGKSKDTEAESVESHLVNCQRCQVYLEVLSEESDSLMQLVADAVATPALTVGKHADSQSLNVGFASREQVNISTPVGSGADNSTYMIRDYRILECIGQGGMGSVYRALHIRLNRQVAVKILKSDRIGPEAISRFAREMRLLAQLEHGHIVRALDAGEHDGLPYFVMEFVNGINLNQLVRRLGPLPVPEACSIVRLAASALQYAHQQKVIHRDIKPSNLMITADGNVKLLDLGLAQILELDADDSVSRADQVLGTLAYMSPEQLSGSHLVTPQSDIFSLGVTLHELLTGQRPFERPGMPPLVSDVRSVRPDVDDELSALVGDMIALPPSERPQSMAEVETRLSAFSPAEDLSEMVAEYYRWGNRTVSRTKSVAANEGVEAGSLQRRDQQPSSKRQGLGKAALAPLSSHAPKRSRAATWLTRSAIALSLFGMGWLAFQLNAKPTLDDSSSGKVTVTAEGKVGSQLLAEGKIKLVNEKNVVFDLSLGESRLPVGTYKMKFMDCPEEFQQNGNQLEVFATATSHLTVNPGLTKSFQYPEIPEQVGASVDYHGTISHAGWANMGKPLAFNIHLEVLSVDKQPDTPVKVWLKVEVTSNGAEDYTETAYLNFDAKKWLSGRKLDVSMGWISAHSVAIESFMANRKTSGSKSKELVVRFDARHDLVSEIDSIPLPKERLSVQDVLSLVFGQDIPSAGGVFGKVRNTLASSGKRNTSLQLVNDAFGDQQCYVVSSREQWDETNTKGFTLARRKSNPFGFILMEMNFPNEFVAVCKIKNSSVVDSGVNELKQRLTEMAQSEFQPGSLAAIKEPPVVSPLPVIEKKPQKRRRPRPIPPPEFKNSLLGGWAYEFGAALAGDLSNRPQSPRLPEPPVPEPPVPDPQPPRYKRFDLAPIPQQPSSQTFHGTIALNRNQSETISATIKMLGEEQVNGRSYRWIDVDFTSRSENYSEFARVLVDATEYEGSRHFAIQKGWIAYGNKESIFELPSDGNLDALVDDRLLFQTKPKWNRIGVVDVLSLLFNTDLKPRTSLGSLRDEFAGPLAGLSREFRRKEVSHKSGESFSCEEWKSPLSLPLLGYTFLRSEQVPFGFVSVTLNRGELRIQLDMESRRLLPSDAWSQSAFGTPFQLQALLQGSQKRLEPKANWQLWTWSHAGKTYKAWAEFGGEIEAQAGRQVLLRDLEGNQIRVGVAALSDVNIASIRKGRLWSKDSFKGSTLSLWRTIRNDNRKLNELTFEIQNSNILAIGKVDQFDPADKEWVKKLRAASDSPQDEAVRERGWQDFAGHIR